MIADHRSIGPGESFTVAIIQHIASGWHTYWVNPGDAGLATRIDWTVPKGYAVGQAEWPAPDVFRSGPVVTYGYEGEAVALQQVRAPPSLDGTAATLSVDVRWLACRDICIPERSSQRIAMQQLATGRGEQEAASTRRIAEARHALPGPAPWNTSITVHPSQVELGLGGIAHDLQPRESLRFLPLHWGEIDNDSSQSVRWSGADAIVTLVRGDLRDDPLASLEGLLLIEPATRGGERRAYRVRAGPAEANTHR